jgi:OmpA-OmpF porin, OOP family
MKKISLKLVVYIIFVFSGTSFSQLARDSWNFGFGGTYPRFMGITPPSHTGRDNYGLFLFIQRNFSEHVGLRFEPNFNHIKSRYDFNSQTKYQNLNLFAGNVDLIYYLVPCEPVSPFINAGFGGIIFSSKNSPKKQYDNTFAAYQFNLGAGAEWKLNDLWKILTAFSYHSASTNEIDGRDDISIKGLFGTTADSYAKFDLGVIYYFYKGEPSHICDIYEGIKN